MNNLFTPLENEHCMRMNPPRYPNYLISQRFKALPFLRGLIFIFSFILKSGYAEDLKEISPSIELQNLFLYRNDSDFDRTEPYYNPDGQSVGVLGTILIPRVDFKILENLRIFYEVELGLNYWSKNNPDQINPVASDIFLVKHRELWTEGYFFDKKLGFKAGYQHFIDPTGLFINHWIGAVNLTSDLEWIKFTSFVGQIPEQTYEGFYINENNFKHDTFIFGARADISFKQKHLLSAGVYSLYDASVIGKTNFILSPLANIYLNLNPVTLNFGVAGQFGFYEHSTLQGEEQNHYAWAFQSNSNFDFPPFVININFLILSPDDEYDMNEKNYGFHYSGKSLSRTLILTEDEIRDKYDNIDEKMATKRGAFFLTRAGFLLVDTKILYIINKYFKPYIIFGGAFVIENKNALGGNFIGIEIDGGFEIDYKDILVFHLVAGALIAGRAASSHINKINLTATDPLYQIESSISVKY